MWLALTTSDLILDVGSIAAVVVAIPLVWSGMRKWRETTTAPITLELSRRLWDDDRLSFKLFHVRDGKDQAKECGPAVNRACALDETSRVGDHVVAAAKLRYARALGVQFKCFADFDDLGLDDVSRLILDHVAGAHDVTFDGTPGMRRAWFLLDSFQTVETLDGFVNNFIYPR